MDWYYNFNGQRTGPVSDAELEQLVVSGVVRPETLVWHAGLPEWQTFGGVGFAGPAGAVSPTGTALPPAFAAGRHYAGFWIRFVAIFIDGMILAIAGLILRGITGLGSVHVPMDMPDTGTAYFPMLGLTSVANIVIAFAYNAFFLTQYGGTLGKLALGLRVIKADGSRLSAGTAIGRYACYWLDIVTIWIGFIIAAFDSQKRAMHDYICGTRVIYKN